VAAHLLRADIDHRAIAPAAAGSPSGPVAASPVSSAVAASSASVTVTASTGTRLAGPPALAWIDHAGGFAPGPGRRSGTNTGEAIAVVEVVADLLAHHASGPRTTRTLGHRSTSLPSTIDLRDVPTDAVAVVCPLSAHRHVLRDLLRERFGGRVSVAGFHELAGLEREVIVCSPAVGAGAPDELVALATDPAAWAAAFRLARRQVIVVADHDWFAETDTALAPLARQAAVVDRATSTATAPRAAG
jgi:hypothetical protein